MVMAKSVGNLVANKNWTPHGFIQPNKQQQTSWISYKKAFITVTEKHVKSICIGTSCPVSVLCARTAEWVKSFWTV